MQTRQENEMKKIIKNILIVIICVCALAGCKNDTDKSKENTKPDFEYEILEDGTIEVTRCNLTEADIVTVPKQIDGMTVTRIGAVSFLDTECEKVVIPDTVISIGGKAFVRCKALKEIEGGNVEIINYCAFLQCESLEKIPEWENLKVIERSAFDGCVSLKNIYLPEGLEVIEEYAFQDAIRLENVNIPSTLKEMGRYAFDGTKWLKEQDDFVMTGNGMLVKIPFEEKVWIPEGTRGMCAYEFNCSETKELYIPEGVETISASYLNEIEEDITLYVPSSVTRIGEAGCSEEGEPLMYENKRAELVHFVVEAGSYAEEYAKHWGIDYEIVDDVQAIYEQTLAESGQEQ